MFERATARPGELALTRRQIVIAGAIIAAGMASQPPLRAETGEEVSQDCESIHQERSFKADPRRVYAALTQAKQFDKITQLSGAPANPRKPTAISLKPGGAFSLFGGYIVGFQLALVPNQLISQAWRVDSWEPGVYSTARFALIDQGDTTKIVFDHAGFPKGLGKHLSSGWQEHYWGPLEKFLS
jgi:activator of HSP90 ATPase